MARPCRGNGARDGVADGDSKGRRRPKMGAVPSLRAGIRRGRLRDVQWLVRTEHRVLQALQQIAYDPKALFSLLARLQQDRAWSDLAPRPRHASASRPCLSKRAGWGNGKLPFKDEMTDSRSTGRRIIK